MSVFIGYPSFMAYQMMKGKKGNNEGFPSIPGMIARYSALGLTNEQMATNPVWVDKTGNGHDLQMKNFAWKGMSGVGGYGDENYQTFYKFTLDNYVFIASPPGVEHMNFAFRVTGLQPGNKLTLAFFGTTNTVYGTWNKDGIYTVDADIVEAGKPTYFYNGYGATRGEFTIEILPLYPGFILGDGIDDFAVTEKELNFEDTYTVYTAFIPFQVDPTRVMEICGKDFKKDFYLYYSNTHVVYYTSGLNNYIPVRINQFHIIVCKRNKTNAVIKNLITGESKTFSVSELIDNPGVYFLWRYQRSGTSTAKTAIAGQTICNGYFSTDRDDEKVLNWYKKQYFWLFPDQAWTVVGKTNEDEDRATIANITGNGNDLVLSNFGFAEGSGYGLYKQDFTKIQWTSPSARAEVTKTNSSFNITEVKKIVIQLYYLSDINEVAFTVPSTKVRVTGLTDGQTINYRYFANGAINGFLIPSDGIYNLPEFEFPAKSAYYGFNLTKVQSSCNITIEQIPEYEGYLITDGVDDRVESSLFTLNRDWTIVGNWTMLSNIPSNCGIIKVPSMFLYNSLDGVIIYFAGGPIKIQSKSINAFCSDGRIYLNDWTEISKPDAQTALGGSKSSLNIASYSVTNFTKMAFKNLAIYDGKNLSKDDCIKVYNYLQSLKAK